MSSSNANQKDSKSQYQIGLKPWIVWGLGCIFYFYESLLQVSPSVMSHELMRDFLVTSQTLGVLAGIYFYSYALMQLPAGLLLDYFGPKRLLVIATLICGLSTIAFGSTDNFWLACIARMMIGLGSAFAAVGTMKLAANWFPAERFALLTGIMVTIGMLGAIGGEAPLALLIDNYNWRIALIIMGVIGIVLAVLLFVIARDVPKGDPYHSKYVKQGNDEGLFSGLKKLLRHKQMWLTATYGGLMFMWTPVFCGLWGVPFLMAKLNIDKTIAANYISLVFVGWAVSSPLWGVFSNRIGRRKPPMYIGTIGALFCSLMILYAPVSHSFIETLLFLFGVFSAGFLPAFAVAREICNNRQVATGLSFMNMMNMIGIALAQPLIGFMLDQFWSGQLVDNVRIYSLQAYQQSLLIMPIGIFIALIILPKMQETYCQSTQE